MQGPSPKLAVQSLDARAELVDTARKARQGVVETVDLAGQGSNLTIVFPGVLADALVDLRRNPVGVALARCAACWAATMS